MKTNSFFIAALLLFATFNANGQIKIVDGNYSSNLTASKSYYEKDVDFDKYFPALNSNNLQILSSRWFPPKNIFNYKGEKTNIPSGYNHYNLTGDTVYLAEDLYIISHFDEQPRGNFCLNGNGNVVDGTMRAGYYEITGYILCRDNEENLRQTHGLYSLAEYYDRGGEPKTGIKLFKNNTIRDLKEAILTDKLSCINDYVEYVIFHSLDGSNNSDDYSPTEFYLCCNPILQRSYETTFSNIMPLRFYRIANSFVGKVVVVRKNRGGWLSLGDIIKDPMSDNLIKIEDKEFVVKDIVMDNFLKEYFAILEGEKTGSFAFRLSLLFGIKDLAVLNRNWESDAEYPGAYDIGTFQAYYYGDVPCFFNYCDQKYDRYNENSLILVRKSDKEKLEKRAKTERQQIEKEKKLKEQRIKQENERKEAAFKQQMIAKHGAKYGELVAGRRVAIDMTKEMCRDAWGKPMNTYRTTTKYGQSEVWCYNYKTRVYFYNGKVVQIDD